MHIPYSHTTQYNNISRSSLKSFPCKDPIVNKQEIVDKIRGLQDENTRAALLSNLIAIKYYRQSAPWNNTEYVLAQDHYWEKINSEKLLPDGTSLSDLMAFLKNDGYFIQRKIPAELNALLVVSDVEKQRILAKFTCPEEREAMRNFLVDATGECWDSENNIDTDSSANNILLPGATFSPPVSDEENISNDDLLPITNSKKRDEVNLIDNQDSTDDVLQDTSEQEEVVKLFSKIEIELKNLKIIIPDLDEGVHALYAFSQNVIKAIESGSLDGLINEFVEEASLLSSQPLKWLVESVRPSVQTSEIALDVSLSAVTLVFAILAIIAGYKEFTEALEKDGELTAVRAKIVKSLSSLDALDGKDGVNQTYLLYAKIFQKQLLATVDSALKDNFLNGGIGLGSLISGSMISINTVSTIVLQGLNIAAASKTAISTTALSSIAIVKGTFLNPIGSGAALLLGGFFLYQTDVISKELKNLHQLLIQNKKLIAQQKSADKNDGPNPRKEKYQAFITRKFTSREIFISYFKKWNTYFTAATSAYIGNATAQLTLTIAAAVVSGILAVIATPVVIATLTVLGIVSGIAMLISSRQFFHSHGKNQKHQEYKTKELPLLGRYFDSFHIRSSHHSNSIKNESNLREALYHFVHERDSLRQCLLQEIAKDTHKFREWKKRATELVEFKNLASKERQRGKNVLAYFSYLGAYLKNRIGMGLTHKEAINKADAAYEQQVDNLTTYSLAQWLAGKELGETDSFTSMPGNKKQGNEKKMREFFTNVLEKQKELLTEKCKAYDTFLPFAKELAKIEGAEILTEAEKEHQKDLADLKMIDQSLSPHTSLDGLKAQFLHLQGVNIDGLSGMALNECLAQYLDEGLTDEETAYRGVLFEMEMESLRMRNELQKTDTQKQSDE